jgi:hypothetical protein
MNQQIIKSLVMDQALNTLSPETEQLLKAYLSEHPEFQEFAESIHQTVALGQKAVNIDVRCVIPPFPRERLLRQLRHTRWIAIKRWKSIAAAILVGISIGFVFQQPRHIEHQADRITSIVQGHSETVPLSSGLDIAQTYWSTKTYYTSYKDNLKRIKTKTDRSGYEKDRNGGLL